MPSGSDSSSSDLEIIGSSTSLNPAPATRSLGTIPQRQSASSAQPGSRPAPDGASGSSPQVGAAAPARGSRGSTVQQDVSKGKGKGKSVETIEISSSDDSDEERLPLPSTLSQTRPRLLAKPQPRISLPHPSTAHRPRPAPRRSEPAVRSLATVTLSSSGSEGDDEKLPRPVAAVSARPTSSQGAAASGTTRPEDGLSIGLVVPRAAVQGQDAARTRSSPAPATSGPSREAARPSTSAPEKLATTSQAHPSPALSRLPASIRKGAARAASRPGTTVVEPVPAAASTSAPRTSFPSPRPRLPSSSQPRSRASPLSHTSDAGPVRASSPPASGQHEPAPSANRLPTDILSKYGLATPSTSSAVPRAALEPARRAPAVSNASAARATSSVESDVEFVRVGRLAVRASSSSDPQPDPQPDLQIAAQPQTLAHGRVATVARESPSEAAPRASPGPSAKPVELVGLSATPHAAERLRSAAVGAGASSTSSSAAQASSAAAAAVGGPAPGTAAASVGSAGTRTSPTVEDQARGGEREQQEEIVEKQVPPSVPGRAGKTAAAAAPAAPGPGRTSFDAVASHKPDPDDQLGATDELAQHAAAAPDQVAATARAPRAAAVVAQHKDPSSPGASRPAHAGAVPVVPASSTAVGSARQPAPVGGRASESRPVSRANDSDSHIREGIVEDQEDGGEKGRGAAALGGTVGAQGRPAPHVLDSPASSRATSQSSSTASVAPARLNTARKSTGGFVPGAARSRPVARKSMGSRQAGPVQAPSSATSSTGSASPAPSVLSRGAGTARKSTGGRPVRAPAAPTRSSTSTSSSSSLSSASSSDAGDSDSSASAPARAGAAPPRPPERAVASSSLALPAPEMPKGSLPTSTARRPATGRKSNGGRAPVAPSRSAHSAEPSSAALPAKRKGPPSPASSTTSTDAPQKKRRRYADDEIVVADAAKEREQLGSSRRLRKSRSRAGEVVVEQAEPLVLEPDTAVAVEMGDQGKVDDIEDKIEQFKRVEASERPWNRLIAGPSYNLDAEFDITIQNEVNRRERRWARRHPDKHPLRESYKTLFELMILEANAKEYSPYRPERRPKIRVLPPTGQSQHHWSSPPFEFIYTNRVIYSDGICPVQAPGCGCKGNCGSSSNRAKCACRRRQIESSTTRPGGVERSGHRDFAYDDGKLVDVVFNRLEPIIECNSECGCGPECVNRVVGLRPSVSVDIYHTGQNGWGVRLAPTYKNELGETHVARVIERGEPLAIYAGELHRTPDAVARDDLVYSYLNRTYIYDLDSWTIPEDIQALAPLNAPSQSYIVQKDSSHMSADHAAPSSKGKGKSKNKKKPTPAPAEEVDNTPTFSSLYSIDAFNVGNWTRFANHVCEGFNVAPRPVYVDDGDVSRPLWVYFALRDIMPGEEINISYAGEEEPDPSAWGYTRAQWRAAADKSRREADKAHRCYCGKPLCRGRMFNNDEAAFWERGDGLARS
ncbi:hypothetical protein JCM3775_005203 [Rhodotorula graminis]